MKLHDPNYIYDVLEVMRVKDGDTVVLKVGKEYGLHVDFGFNVKDEMLLRKSASITFRLYGINTPEMHGESAARGEAAKAALKALLRLGPIQAKTYKPDKYGRFLVELLVRQADGTILDVNKTLVEAGHAKPYFGEGPKL